MAINFISKVSRCSLQALGALGTLLLISSLGIAYQLIALDPLIDTAQCTRDAKLMKELNANVIRVYHVDPTADHKGCMAAFADVGIYLFVDLDTFETQFNQVCPSMAGFAV